jgi:hypothetical protein
MKGKQKVGPATPVEKASTACLSRETRLINARTDTIEHKNQTILTNQIVPMCNRKFTVTIKIRPKFEYVHILP